MPSELPREPCADGTESEMADGTLRPLLSRAAAALLRKLEPENQLLLVEAVAVVTGGTTGGDGVPLCTSQSSNSSVAPAFVPIGVGGSVIGKKSMKSSPLSAVAQTYLEKPTPPYGPRLQKRL